MEKTDDNLIPELRDLLGKLMRLDEKELISYWIEGELEEAEMYSELARTIRDIVWDDRIPKVFEELANQRLQHSEILLKTYKSLFREEPTKNVDLPPM
ncbi:hypothetical protein A3L09_04695 [Thermococcus profundus]|uniref:Ferritin-like diiron domain-containing protein n=1 Tax=Thermococcus profundus TaxID=49899 RepID=A0A2Z2MA20_THEPR|nr:ferritin family protein [Thermococcus profundus]ASJ02606.1 hypothetical protein A3L09_04695 [Thermococcus profundus]